MSRRCEDCGCILESGICSNCHEETFIDTFQSEYITELHNEEWQNKVKEQAPLIRKNREKAQRELVRKQYLKEEQ